MFIKHAWQKQGIGNALLGKAVELAKTHNYKLDTLNYMGPAIKLYKDYGFYEIQAYYNNPNSTPVYFEITLNSRLFFRIIKK